MVAFFSAVAGLIQPLLQTVNETNFDSTFRELCEYADYGSEGCILLLRACLNEVLLRNSDIQQLKRDLVGAIIRYLMDRPNFSSCLCEALRNISVREGFLEHFSKGLVMSLAEKIGISLALCDSENLDLRTRGQSFCISQIEELCANRSSDLRNEQIQDVVMFLYRTEGLAKHVDSFTKYLSLLPLKGSTFFLPIPFLKGDSGAVNYSRHLDLFSGSTDDYFDDVLAEIEREMSMADVVSELGYRCTQNNSVCIEMLSQFLPLTEVTIAKLLGALACTHTGLEDTQSLYASFFSAINSSLDCDSTSLNSWNVDVLVDSIKQLAPKIKWTLVVENLDHDGFNIPDETAFFLLTSVYHKACQDPFPLHSICGSVWKNAEGQLSFLKYAVSAPPEIFTFAHSPRQLTSVEFGHLKHGNCAWLCLDLLEVLCELAERGYASSIRKMLDYPLNNCPEVLLLGVSYFITAYNLVQYEVFSTVFPMVLKDSSRSSIIHHLWRVNSDLVLRGFIDFHDDPNNFLRILDICQDMKILSSVLERSPFSFSIKLAAVASKEQINLENWLSDNLNTYKGAFLEECVKFLNNQVNHAKNETYDGLFQQSQSVMINAYQEARPMLFKVLQSQSTEVFPNHRLEEIKKMHFSSDLTVSTEASSSEAIPDDIESDANAYFHQMFSGQLTIDAMVKMLARFKESPQKREQMTFECIIRNLFEEYKFFSKYPDRQLKLVAVLFGLLIKHQLITHLALGIALRGVLDSLRKSVDSKMFMFGTKALEQFTDRLVEWPQYCNHILQISHLRATHPELVSFIERTLTRISSSQSETSINNSVPADQLQVSGVSGTENMEVSESSWQSTAGQLGQQFSSLQMQQGGLLGERLKPSIPSVNYTKPLLTHSAQSSFLSGSVDSSTNQKSLQTSSSHQSVSGTTALLSSPGFLRSRSATPAGMLRQTSHTTGFGAALNIETLVTAAERRDMPIEAPSPEIQDKLLFMINNISTTNIDSKANEFNEILKEQYFPWFAQYMVMKRASIEPNFHDLYLKFLDRINSKSLNNEIVKSTYENCKVLLRSDLIKSSSEERSLLKNLGSWLGKFTIGRNQALRAKELEPKALIIEAYEKGLMIAVIPFTSKILEPCQSSLAYQPPNPWTMAILSLLTEIYNLPNLKMNLKFDIEVLFKNLGVDMKEVKPTSLLKDRVREVDGNPDFSNKDITAVPPQVIVDVNSGTIPSLNHMEPEVNSSSHPANHPTVLAQYTAPLTLNSSNLLEDDKVGPLNMPERVQSGHGLSQITQLPSLIPSPSLSASPSLLPSQSPSPSPTPSPFSLSQLLSVIPNADSYININPKLISMGSQLQFHRIIIAAIERAIKDIVSPVIQRSVTIASRTTKELVLKDYSMETDDNVISRAAHLMVGTLAGSLAHVTCKEPLRQSLSGHLRSLIQSFNVPADRIDQIVQILTNDHLDLGCALIENVASEKAVELIDGEIGPAFSSLRKHREATGSAYYDAGAFGQGPFSRLPEALYPKPGRLSLAQQRVYDDFVKNIWQNQSNQTSTASAGPPGISGNSSAGSLSRMYGGSSSASFSSNSYSTSEVAPFISQPLDLISEESESGAPQALSVSSSHGSPIDGLIQYASDITSLVTPLSTVAATSELHLLDPSTEMGSVSPPSPVPPADHLPISLLSTGDVLEKYQQVTEKLEALIAKDARDADIQGVVAEVPDMLVRCVSRDEAALAVAKKVFKSLYENATNNLYVASYLEILAAIRDVCKLVVKELTSWVIYSDEDQKFNKQITVGLIRSELLNLVEYNVHLAKLIDGGRNKAATDFAISLLQALLVQESGVSISELFNLVEALGKLSMRPESPEWLQQLIEVARNSVNYPPSLSAKEEKARQIRLLSGRSLTNREELDSNEPATADSTGFKDQVNAYFAEWCRICELPSINETTSSNYITQLLQNGLLKGDDTTERFFHILTELAVSQCLSVSAQVNTPNTLAVQSAQQLQHLSFASIDSYAKLAVLLVLKHLSIDQGTTKASLLPKIFLVTVRIILKESEEKKLAFNPRPYFRLFVNWLLELTSSDVADSANFQVLTYFANAFHALQPLKVPALSFAWLELVSHRSFMPKLLTCNSPKGWPLFQRLLVDLFKFMEPFLRNVELTEPIQFLYKGTLRVLLVLLHDFPEFLCDYHFSFCDVIPPSCIQMRNVILSAFPRNMRLPDPSTPNLKIDLLAEMILPPRILSDFDGALKAKQIKAEIDEYLKNKPEGSSFLAELKPRLLLPQNEANSAGTCYNVPLINSLVLYVGMQAIQLAQNKSSQLSPMQQVAHSPTMDVLQVSAAMEIFHSLIRNFDTEGRYLFLNAIANQLRYPNNHTHYYSYILLCLFAEANQEIIQEQITRVLLERLIVNRPHPWGLLITFIELIKNPRYNFWSRSFTRCAPEIEKLFESVSRSCGGPKAMDDGMVSGGISDGNNH